ncbi:tape measure protein [Enterobacter roggenkampii]|uniref:tape measure protein n=1 Tax=Enterobacter roggenkampii TaxID=1812935 RepID=UPI0038907876
MAENVGDIEYVIKADTAQLLRADKQVVNITNNMESGFKKADKSADALNTGLTKLASTLKLVIAAGTLREMARMVQSYQEMSERVQMATSSQEEFQSVQKRLLNTANDTYRSLSEAQELYITTADSLRSMGYSTQQALDVQDSMSFAFVKNATSADRANNAISAFSKSINKGKVEADSWETIIAAIPSVIGDIATASGKTTAEIMALGSAGKLTASQLTEGLKASLDSNASAAKGMSNNLTDAGVRIKTAITEILVSFEGQTSVLQTFTNGLISAADVILEFGRDSESMAGLIDTATIAAKAFALVMAGRYAGALNTAIAGKVQSVSATRQMVTAESQAAQAALIAANATRRKAVADKEAALSAVALAQAEYNVAKGSAAEMLAMDALVAAKTRATTASLALAEAETAQAAASARAATAARAASIGIGMARGALALIGGPAGAAMLAAGAIFYFWQKAQQAKEEAIAFADGLDKLNAAMNVMSNTQLRGAIADANTSIRAQKEVIADLQSEVDSLNARYRSFTPEAQRYADSMGQGTEFTQRQSEVSDELARKTRDLQAAKDKLSKTEDTASEATRTLTNNMLSAMGVHDDLTEKATILAGAQTLVAKAFGDTAAEITKANDAGQNFNPKSLQISPATKEGDKVIAALEEQNELLKIQGEREREIAKARMQAAKVTDNQNQISAAGRLAAENYDLEKSEEARKKAQQESEQQGKKSASSAESVAQKLANLKQQAELAAGSTQELSREQAMLNAEQSIGKGATQAQIAEARQYAAAKWDTANAIKAQAAAEKLLPEARENASYKQDVEDLKTALAAKKINQDQYNKTAERLEENHQVNLAKIRAQQVVTPQQSALGEIDPVQQLENQHAQQLALIQQFETQKGQITQRGLELMNAANTQYEQARIAAQWEIYRNHSTTNQLMADAVDSLQSGATNAITGLINGTQSLQESFANIGTTILNSVVGSLVQMGIEWVKIQLMGQAAAAASLASTMAQATAAASAWAPAAVSASIATLGSAAAVGQTAYAGSLLSAKGMAIAGARYNGGPVSANSMYRVGEGGKPEIYQANNGSQYMIPGDNGRVISNRDMQGSGSVGGSVVQHITFEINTTGGIDDATMAKMSQMMKQVSLNTIRDQQRPNGLLRR